MSSGGLESDASAATIPTPGSQKTVVRTKERIGRETKRRRCMLVERHMNRFRADKDRWTARREPVRETDQMEPHSTVKFMTYTRAGERRGPAQGKVATGRIPPLLQKATDRQCDK